MFSTGLGYVSGTKAELGVAASGLIKAPLALLLSLLY